MVVKHCFVTKGTGAKSIPNRKAIKRRPRVRTAKNFAKKVAEVATKRCSERLYHGYYLKTKMGGRGHMRGEEQKMGGVACAGVSSRVDIEYCIHWSRLGL